MLLLTKLDSVSGNGSKTPLDSLMMTSFELLMTGRPSNMKSWKIAAEIATLGYTSNEIKTLKTMNRSDWNEYVEVLNCS